jgi:hypothetical protein
MANKSTVTHGIAQDGLTTGHLSQGLANSTATTGQAGGASNGVAGGNTRTTAASTKK